jgi:hypothetical protein
MKWLRFSIATLMAFILYAGIGLTALNQVSDPYWGKLWDGGYYMATLFALAVASIIAVLSRGRSQARWLGFAVFGWVHLIFGWPDSAGWPEEAPGSTFRPRFPHITFLSWLISTYLFPGNPHPWAQGRVVQVILPPIAHPLQGNYTWHVVQTSVTMATALVGAVVGNLLAVWVERGRSLEHPDRSVGGHGQI